MLPWLVPCANSALTISVKFTPQHLAQWDDIESWCIANLGEQNVHWGFAINQVYFPFNWYFDNQTSATLFQLTWGLTMC